MIMCRFALAALAGLLFGFVGHAAESPQPEAVPAVPLHQAAAEGKVHVDVSSLGGATGNRVVVDVQSRVNGPLRLRLAEGSVFVSVNVKVQNMTGRQIVGEYDAKTNTYQPGNEILLLDGRRRSFLIESYCLDYHRPPPHRGDRFKFALLDCRAARIFAARPKTAPSEWAFQCAIWMDRAGVPASELQQRYRVGQVDINVAVNLMRQAEQQGIAGLPRELSPQLRPHLEKVFSSDPRTRASGVEALSRLGPAASAVAPLVAVNVVSDRPGIAATTQVNVAVNAQQAAEWLERVDVPAARAWAQALRQNATAGGVQPLLIPPTGLPGVVVATDFQAPLAGALLDRAIENLKARRPFVRRQAAMNLGATKSPRAVEALLDALGDTEPGVRDAAAGALKRITGQDHGADAEKWRGWWAANKASFEPAGQKEF